MVKSKTFRTLTRVLMIVAIFVTILCSLIAAFVPTWINNVWNVNLLMTKFIVIILSVSIGKTILSVMNNIAYESYLKILKSESATMANALSDTIDLTDDEIDKAISRLTLLKESRVKPKVTKGYDWRKENKNV